MAQTLIQVIASTVQARVNCQTAGNTDWLHEHTDRLSRIERELLPSGSGVDAGTKIDLQASRSDRIVLTASYHHMDDSGGYDGWTEHTIVVTPSFSGVNIRITGRDRNGIKEYLGDLFDSCLSHSVVWAHDRYVFETKE